MLLPQALLRSGIRLEPMVATDVARAVAGATRDYLGQWGGITQLLTVETGWVGDFEQFSRILVETIPTLDTLREARAMAGRTPALYLPGTGALVNGGLVAGRTTADMGEALDNPAVAARVALHLAHEVAGHAYMAENTPLGGAHANAGRRRDAMAFAGRIIASAGDGTADREYLDLASRFVIIAEGWACWVTEKLRPLLAERLPHVAEYLATPAKQEGNAEASRLLGELLGQVREEATEGVVADKLAAVALHGDPVTSRALGAAVFAEIEKRAGAEGCIHTLQSVGRSPDRTRADVTILQALADL